jgi:F-type H+-transporting ATPase subunit b
MIVVTTKRTDIHVPKYYDPEEHQKLDNFRKSYIGQGKSGAEAAASVGLIGKLIARFRGQALPGEKEAPKALFANAGLHWLPPKPLPRVPADYKEHPERDLVNFPFPQRFMFAPKSHFLFLPDSWFQALYKVSGSSGPYMLIFSLGAFLVNKEFLVWDVNVALLFYGWLAWFGIAHMHGNPS